VNRFNGRHLDERRLLLPRTYAMDPTLFGVDPALGFFVPDGGDVVSMLVAQQQHSLVCAWERRGVSFTAQALAVRYGTSIQVISQTARGERWAGETMFAALVESVARRGRAQRRPT